MHHYHINITWPIQMYAADCSNFFLIEYKLMICGQILPSYHHYCTHLSLTERHRRMKCFFGVGSIDQLVCKKNIGHHHIRSDYDSRRDSSCKEIRFIVIIEARIMSAL